MLGALKAGCGFLAVDAGAPPARKAFIVNDSGAAILFINTQLENDFADIRCPSVAVDKFSTSTFPDNRPLLKHEIESSDVAYCLYTSGTTGNPKGCLITHENVVQAMMSFRRLFRWNEHSKWLQFAAYHFDVSVMEQYWAWGLGLCVIGAPRDLIFEDLAGTVNKLGITHIDLTPSLAQTLSPSDVPTLRQPDSVFITGGEPLREEIIAKWGPYGTIYNGYGPTEATIGCTMYPRVGTLGKPSNIGWQFDNVGTVLMKPGTSEIVPRGVIGELCVYGPLVAKGYLNRPEKTAESFQRIELNGKLERVYRTGDLVRLLHDGSFIFSGRIDDQVKIRGQRIEIDEINAVVKRADVNVESVATLKLKHPKQPNEQLVTFFSTAGAMGISKPKSASVLLDHDVIVSARRACQDHLPTFAIPTYLIPLNFIPLTNNNKIDNKMLRSLFDDIDLGHLHEIGSLKSAHRSLSNSEQKILTAIQTVVNTGDTSPVPNTSIFELGLDSVSIIPFAALLRDLGYWRARPSLIMKNSTIESLASQLQVEEQYVDDGGVLTARQVIRAMDHRYRRLAAERLDVAETEIEYVAPCTPLQQGILARTAETRSATYFARFRFELRPDVDFVRLRKALETIFEEVQMLRTKFVSTDEGYLQVVIRSMNIQVVEHASETRRDALQKLDAVYEDWKLSNSESLDKLLQIVVIHATETTVLDLHLFHALYDGISLELLLQVVRQQYFGAKPNYGPSFLAALPYGPLRHVEGGRSFWTQHLQGGEDIAASEVEFGHNSDTVSKVTNLITAASTLDKCRRDLGVTHQALMQACWMTVIRSTFGLNSTGMVVSGRSNDFTDVERVIGPMFNTIAFKLCLDQEATWASIARDCHNFNMAVLPHQQTSLRDIVKWCKEDGIIHSDQSLFQTFFVFRQASDAKEEHDLEALWTQLDVDEPASDYPLALEVEQLSDTEVKTTLVAQGWLADQEKLKSVSDHFEDALAAFLTDSDARINLAFPDINSKAKRSVLERGNANGGAKPNGHAKLSRQFTWSPHASIIREEISLLCNRPTEEITADMSILELGLDSVDAVKLSSRLKRRTGLQLPFSQIMRSMTLAKMCESIGGKPSISIEETQASSHGKTFENLRNYCNQKGISLDQSSKVLPASPLQEGMVSEMRASGYKNYFNHDILRLYLDTDIVRLKRAWKEAIGRYEILRTAFVQIEAIDIPTHYAQLVHDAVGNVWYDCEIDHPTDFEGKLNNIRRELQVSPESKVPLRLTSLRSNASGQPAYLVLSIAHALYDGWSLSMLHRDVHRLYYGDQLPDRPPYDTMLLDSLKASGNMQAQDYWRNVLNGMIPTNIRKVSTTAGIQSHRAELVSTAHIAKVKTFCQENNVLMSALAQTTFVFVLASYVRQLDVAFGQVLSCRDTEDIENMMFPTMNTVAIRAVLHGNKLDMVRYSQANMDEVRLYQSYPLRKALTAARANTGIKRLFDTLFLYQVRPEGEKDDHRKPLYESVHGSSGTEYPLAVEAEVTAEGLIWRAAGEDQVFDAIQLGHFLGQLDETLGSIVEKPDEQCVRFVGSQTSICGLSPFMQDEEQSEETQDAAGQVVAESVADTGDERKSIVDAICNAISKVADTPSSEVDANSTIYKLGLDSISAIKLSSLLSKNGLRLKVSDILRLETPAQMAQCVDKTQVNDPAMVNGYEYESLPTSLNLPDIESYIQQLGVQGDDVESVMPVTAGQAYMLVMHAHSGRFQPTFEFTIGNLPRASEEKMADQLTVAWNRLVIITPSLRTVALSTGKPEIPFVQIVLTPNGTASFSERQRSGEIAIEVAEQAIGTKTPFVRLILPRPQDVQALNIKLRIHHALYDAVSLDLLMQRFAQLLSNPTTSLEPPAANLSSSFSSLVAATITAKATEERQRYWTSYFSSAQRSLLSPTVTDSANRRVEHFNPTLLNRETTKLLSQAARSLNTSFHAVFLAAYARVHKTLISHPKSSDVVIGIYLANRAFEQDTPTLLAPTLNIVPLRVRDPIYRSISATAQDIQSHLQALSQDIARASVSLHDIARLTKGRVTIDTTVNFLSLPSSTDDESSLQDSNRVEIVSVNPEEYSCGYSRVVDAPDPPGQDKVMSMKNIPEEVRRAYVTKLDIEATVTKKGELALGVFSDESVLGLERAKKLEAGLRRELEGIADGTR